MISLDSALSDVTKLGFDTSPFIYFIERVPAYLDIVREIIHRVDEGTVEAYTSTITITEVLVLPLRTGNARLQREYRDLLVNGRNLRFVTVNAHVAEGAAELRARYNMRTPGALQIASSIESKCEVFLTNDLALKRVSEIRVLVLNELEL